MVETNLTICIAAAILTLASVIGALVVRAKGQDPFDYNALSLAGLFVFVMALYITFGSLLPPCSGADCL